MWIVKNRLRGTLTLRGMGISIPAGAEFDLDSIGRKTAEMSHQVIVAFEEGYLQNIVKDSGAPPPPSAPSTPGMTASELEERLARYKEEFLSEFKSLVASPGASAMSKGDLDQLHKGIVGDVKSLLEGLKVAKSRIGEEKARILVDKSLSDAEIRARLAFLEQQEREIGSNFSQLGRQSAGEGDGNILGNADLLSEI